MNRLYMLLKRNWILFLVVLGGIFFRVYKPLEFYMYGHDYDLAGWIVKDVLVNHHLRLIGQQTSSVGIFIGPLFYYLQIPFYLLTKMDPVGTLLLPLILSIFSIFSFYFVFSKIFTKTTGLIAALTTAFSAVIIFTDRGVVPTMPVMLWTVWYFYSLWLLLKGKQKAYILIGFLFGLIWHLNLALAVLSPLVILAQIFSKKKLSLKSIFVGLSLFIVLMLPFFAFEARHDFRQTKSVIESFTSEKDYVPGTGRGYAKFDRVMQLVHINTKAIFLTGKVKVFQALTFYILVGLFIFLVNRKVISKEMAIFMFLWQVFYIAFFTFNSINVSEYYLNGMNVIWIAIFALGVNYLLQSKHFRYLGLGVLAIFVLLNIWTFFTREENRSGYLERKAIVAAIEEDAKAHGYPCVAVSYIASPGNNLGYRYLFWLKGMHINQPVSGSPVYTIVFPLSMVNGVDKTFGVIGLVLPDYERYTGKEVEVSCSGANSNLTDPMFGYTE